MFNREALEIGTRIGKDDGKDADCVVELIEHLLDFDSFDMCPEMRKNLRLVQTDTPLLSAACQAQYPGIANLEGHAKLWMVIHCVIVPCANVF